MKKKITKGLVRPNLFKISLRMKFTTFLLVVSLFEMHANIYSQNTKISMTLKNVSVETVLKEVESKTEYRFIYNNKGIDLERKISFNVKKVSVKEILKQLFKDTKIEFVVYENRHILLYLRKDKNETFFPIERPEILKETVIKVSGKVIDEKGQPLSGVNIKAKGTSISTQTDAEGGFSLKLPDNVTTLIVSYIGMESQEVKIVGDDLVIILREEGQKMDEVVIIGYGSAKKKDLTTAIGSVTAKDLENQPVGNISEAIVGKMAGVNAVQGSGKPGGSLDIRIRGIGTITAGSEPLYVVDGIPLSSGSLSTINTNDIESIEILKDASSAAIYGSRGSNGVVIITSKKGKKGKTTIGYNGFTGIQSLSKKIKMLDAYQYAELTLEARNNSYSDALNAINKGRLGSGLSPISYNFQDDNATRLIKSNNNLNTIVPTELIPYLNGVKGLTNTDWQDEIYRDALIQNHTISASGGSENMKYYTSLEYFGQEGIVINSDFERYGLKLNLDGYKGSFKYGVLVNPTYTTENIVNTDGAFNSEGVVASALHYSPIFTVYNPDGSFNFAQNNWSADTQTVLPDGKVVVGNAQTQAWNPVALATLTENKARRLRVLSNFYLEAEFAKDLKYKISVGLDASNRTQDYFHPSTIPLANTSGNPESIAYAWSKSDNELNWVLEQTLNYTKKWENHSLSGLAGWTLQKNVFDNNYVYAGRGFISNDIHTVNAGIVTDGSSIKSEFSLASGLARLQYNYKGRYLASAAFRADGASRFGEDHRWGYFPSASVGWKISEENFLKNVNWINDLKLRSSYGVTGNFNIPNYGSQGAISNYGYILGGANAGAVNGAAPSSKPNPDLRWEKTNQVNFGLDFAVLKNALTLNVDIYNSNTSDLLLNVPIPISTGYSSELTNIGKVNNKGIEINLGINPNLGNLKWSTNINFSKNINEVKELGPGNADIIKTGSVSNAYFLTRVGQPIGSYYLPVVLGVFKNQAEIDSYPHYIDTPSNNDLATTKPGDFKFKDVDGDGVIDLTKDREIVGNYSPKFTYGFSTSLAYKNFDFAVAIQGAYGNEILNLSRRYFYNHEGNMNNYVGALDRWKSESEPGSGWNVRPNRVAKGLNGTTSTWHVEDGSYLRIRNVTIGYNIPLNNTSFITKTRIYISVQNLHTFTKYQGYNPEVSNNSNATQSGEDYGVYPLARTVSMGLNLTF
ncbi:TonB-dependent receptor [Flavobacterium sp. LAR06]|uniref:TonB-dependent receptor n=1 Tax=Flavobacterium sp. LAR06 TaxID=3064897 RepID=UPI0035C0026F